MVVFAMNRLRRRRAPLPVADGTPAWRGAAAFGGLLVVMVGGLAQSHTFLPRPDTGDRAVHAHVTDAFRRIILPDLVVIEPKGIGAGHLARLAKIPGVSQTLAVDGATITLGGRKLNAIGVNADQFRPWTPLHTASDTRLWSVLAHGGFVAAPKARREMRLRAGAGYQLTGASTASLTFGGAAPLGIVGIDLVVSNTVSARLGLIHDVAVFISAPGKAMAALRRGVRAVTGTGAKVIGLRQEQLPVGGAASGRPSTYLELFKASAAKYCPGLSWTVLAAIGQIESGDGTNNGPSSAGALGPMQFLPSTWRKWGITAFGERGPPSITDPYDAVPSAARYLCAAGAGTPAGLPRAIFAYNHADWYVAEVLALAHEYAQTYG